MANKGKNNAVAIPIEFPINQNGYVICDIGANLLDDMFSGIYNGKPSHDADMHQVLQRAHKMGVAAIIVTAGTIDESRAAITFVRKFRSLCSAEPKIGLPTLYTTVGIHPTRCSVFDCPLEQRASIIFELENLIADGITDGAVVAVGECGLDYDRLHFCSKELQKEGFLCQINIAAKFNLPLFLHDRNCEDDFAAIIHDNMSVISRVGGVAHSFTDSMEHMHVLLDLGLYIGINGCSLKSEQNIEVASSVPLDRLLLETDAPYCGIKKTHAGYKNIMTHFPQKDKKKFNADIHQLIDGRTEPCLAVQVLEVLAAVRGGSTEELAQQIAENTERLFKFRIRPSIGLVVEEEGISKEAKVGGMEGQEEDK